MKKIVFALNWASLLLTSQLMHATAPVASADTLKNSPGAFVEPFSLGTLAIFPLTPLLNGSSYPNANVVFTDSVPAAFPDNVVYPSGGWSPPADITPASAAYPSLIDGVTSNQVPVTLSPGSAAVIPLTGTTRTLKETTCLSGSLTCQTFSLDIIQHAFVSNFGTSQTANAVLNQEGLFSTLNSEATPGVSITEPYQIALNRIDTRAYIASRADSQVFQCSLDTDQSFSGCTDSGNTGVPFDDPSGITLNNANTFAYVTNQSGGTTGAISVCPILDNGLFGACLESGNTSFTFGCPNGIALNSTGTRAYVADGCTDTVTMCPVEADGNLGDCVDAGAGAGASFVLPVGLATPPPSSFIYVTNLGGDSISQCFINFRTGLFSSCVDAGATGLSSPFGINLTRLGDVAYVSNTDSSSITRLQTLADGTFGESQSITDPNLNTPIWMKLD